jgi:hypothetical protein
MAMALVLVLAAGGCDLGGEDEREPDRARQSRPAPPGSTTPRSSQPAPASVCETEAKAARRRIAYAKGSAIWTSRLDGRGARQVTRREYGAGGATFEPGGRRIVFRDDRGRTGEPDIFTIARSGRGERLLTRDLGADPSAPAWSPDGQRIAFTDSFALMIIDAEGGERTALAPELSAQSPAWSPDGRWILFHGTRRQEPEARGATGGDLWMVRADGTDLRQLTDTPADEEADPVWSPDGRTIAYHHNDVNRGIWVVRSDGRGRRRLTNGDDFGAAWGSDCRTIAFTRFEGQSSSIEAVSLQGKRRVPGRPVTAAVLGDWSRPAPGERGVVPRIAPPPPPKPEPPPPDTREEVLGGVREVCSELAGTLGRLGQPRDLEELRRYAPRARAALVEAVTELGGLLTADDMSFDSLLEVWRFQRLLLEEIQMSLNRGEQPHLGLKQADDTRRYGLRRARSFPSECRATLLPRLVPGLTRVL